jgi:hypothetical protein
MQRQALAQSEMMREMQQMLQLVNAAGVGAWDEVRSQGSNVVETLATDIQRSYDTLANQLQDQVRRYCRSSTNKQLHQLLSGLATEVSWSIRESGRADQSARVRSCGTASTSGQRDGNDGLYVVGKIHLHVR